MIVRHRVYCLLTLLLTAASAAGETETTYYAVFLMGQKIGHASHIRTAVPGKVTHIDTLELTLGRGEVPITIRQFEATIETPDGKPLGFESVQGQTKSEGTVSPDGTVTVTTSSVGEPQKQTLKWPQGAIMNEALRLLQMKKGLKEGTSYTVSVFIPSMLRALETRITVGPRRKVDLLGRVISVTEVQTNIQMPIGEVSATEYVDEHFRVQKFSMSMMGMVMEMIACDEAFALSRNTLVDFMDKSLLSSPSPLGDLTFAKSATYTLAPRGNNKLSGIISTDNQTVQPGAKGALIVTVRPIKAQKGAKFPYKGADTQALAALKPNRYVQSENKRVVALARKAVGETKDAAVATKRIEDFVGKYITEKSLSVGYATAAEVALSKEGDCTEHAVLTAAMCRAVGIPARMAVGVVYVPQFGERKHVFGGHAWVEAFVGGKWIALDPTRGRFSVGHITHAVGSGEPTDFFALINTIGSFKIAKVVVER